MQININNNISAQNVAGSLAASKNKRAKAAKADTLSANVKVKYAQILEKAQHGEDIDPRLVENAKKMLASGQLDTPEGAKQAAKKLLEYGI